MRPVMLKLGRLAIYALVMVLAILATRLVTRDVALRAVLCVPLVLALYFAARPLLRRIEA